MVVLPSPFQSPTTAPQLGKPYWNGAASGAPALRSFRKYQMPVAASKAPMPLAGVAEGFGPGVRVGVGVEGVGTMMSVTPEVLPLKAGLLAYWAVMRRVPAAEKATLIVATPLTKD